MLKPFDYITLIILVSYLIGNFINVNHNIIKKDQNLLT